MKPFPIPYPGNDPTDEMDAAIGRLRALRLALMADGHGLADYSSTDADMMIGEVLDQLDPIRTFLAKNAFHDAETPFLECRREWVARTGGAA